MKSSNGKFEFPNMCRISITGEDIQTLEGLNWLNDNIVNFYMSMIEVLFQVLSSSSQLDLTQARSRTNKNLPSSYSFSTFFYPRLQEVPISSNLFTFLQPSPSSLFVIVVRFILFILQVGHQGVSRWTRNVDIFSYDLLLVIVTVFVTTNMITFITINFNITTILIMITMITIMNRCQFPIHQLNHLHQNQNHNIAQMPIHLVIYWCLAVVNSHLQDNSITFTTITISFTTITTNRCRRLVGALLSLIVIMFVTTNQQHHHQYHQFHHNDHRCRFTLACTGVSPLLTSDT